jgi:hypothetical protein
MAFSISFLDGPPSKEDPENPDDPTEAAIGRLVIGDWYENFVSSLYCWSMKEYEDQWGQAIRVLLDGCDRAGLITEYCGPEAGRLWWWKMYRIEDTVYFQEQILFFDQLKGPFRLEEAFSYVSDREKITEEGLAISEWSVGLEALAEFARGFS